MRYFLVVQSLHQLRGRYEEDADTIKGNCDNWVFLTSRELDLLNEISELCGSVLMTDGRERRLISVSELQRLDKSRGEALIMHARQYPIISELTDIDDYSMFGNHEPEVLEDRDYSDVACFSIDELIEKIKEAEAIAPFPKDVHKRLQAQKIYAREIVNAAVETEPVPNDETDEQRVAREIRYLTAKKKSRDQGVARAREKIAELLGEKYADEFISLKEMDNLPDVDDDDDDDFDW